MEAQRIHARQVGRVSAATARRSSWQSQPNAVWAVAFACVVSFMGLGLVDPILPAISRQLHATQAQVELLFTSYLAVTGVAMLITGPVSSRLGCMWWLLGGTVHGSGGRSA